MSAKQGGKRGSFAVKPVCPLCGEEATQDPAHTFIFLGYVYAFCCQACRDCFVRTPEQFIVQLAHEYDAHLGYSCPRDGSSFLPHNPSVFSSHSLHNHSLQ